MKDLRDRFQAFMDEGFSDTESYTKAIDEQIADIDREVEAAIERELFRDY